MYASLPARYIQKSVTDLILLCIEKLLFFQVLCILINMYINSAAEHVY